MNFWLNVGFGVYLGVMIIGLMTIIFSVKKDGWDYGFLVTLISILIWPLTLLGSFFWDATRDFWFWLTWRQTWENFFPWLRGKE